MLRGRLTCIPSSGHEVEWGSIPWGSRPSAAWATCTSAHLWAVTPASHTSVQLPTCLSCELCPCPPLSFQGDRGERGPDGFRGPKGDLVSKRPVHLWVWEDTQMAQAGDMGWLPLPGDGRGEPLGPSAPISKWLLEAAVIRPASPEQRLLLALMHAH